MISEPVLIRLSRDGLRPFIYAQAEQKDRRRKTWDQPIEKAIMTKAKDDWNVPLWVHKMDFGCPRGHNSALKLTKNHTQN